MCLIGREGEKIHVDSHTNNAQAKLQSEMEN